MFSYPYVSSPALAIEGHGIQVVIFRFERMGGDRLKPKARLMNGTPIDFSEVLPENHWITVISQVCQEFCRLNGLKPVKGINWANGPVIILCT